MKIISSIARYLEYAACFMLCALILLTMAHVVSDYFFGHPIAGTIEISQFMLVMIMALGLSSAAVEQRHIKVDLLMMHLPKKVQLVIDTGVLIVTSVMLAIMTWANYKGAMSVWRTYSTLNIPDRPFRLAFTVCLGFLCICTLAVMINNLRKRGEK
jgi:TRAP-type C4-dicarboxylate transport system permease small subunit